MAQPGRYFTICSQGGPVHVWHFDGRLAQRVGVPNAIQIDSAHVELLPGETLEAAIARKFPAWAKQATNRLLGDMILAPGQYFERMARPSDQHPEQAPGSNPGAKNHYDELAVMRGQLISLMHSLIDICQVVHPDAATWRSYGHEIRNLLILASTEVEAHWRAVLIANGYRKERFTTNDYVLLANAMKLGQFGLTLPYYPWLPPICPFADWGSSGRPTKELRWYDAYNAVKHDRQENFHRATLENAINAVVACAIMLMAQFGQTEAFRWRVEFGYFFNLAELPRWDRTEVYTYPYEEWTDGIEAVRYPFPDP